MLRDGQYTPLCEDIVCVVEEFLFSRNRSRGKDRMLERCLLEDDVDGVVYLFETYVGSVPFTGTDFERRVFRSAYNSRAVALLLSFGDPSNRTLKSMVMCWALEGRSELLQVLCETLEKIPRILVGMAKHELRYARRGDWPDAEKYMRMFETPSFWDPLDHDYLLKTSDELLLSGRRKCFNLLIDYEKARAGTPWITDCAMFP